MHERLAELAWLNCGQCVRNPVKQCFVLESCSEKPRKQVTRQPFFCKRVEQMLRSTALAA
jgi:hypothetical protein